MKSWRTTLAGILTILGVLVKVGTDLLNGHPPDVAVAFAGIMVGIGLISARDNKVSSEQAGAK